MGDSIAELHEFLAIESEEPTSENYELSDAEPQRLSADVLSSIAEL